MVPIGYYIWGKNFLDEMSEPHHDPAIRKMEEEHAELWRQYLLNRFKPRRFDNDRYLPAHYRSKE